MQVRWESSGPCCGCSSLPTRRPSIRASTPGNASTSSTHRDCSLPSKDTTRYDRETGLKRKKKLFSSEMCVTGNRKQCQVVARPAALQHNRLVWIHPHNTMNMMYLSVESVFLQCVLCAAVCCVIKRIKIAQNKLLVAYFVTGGLLLKVICNGFSQNWWKVVSSCLL